MAVVERSVCMRFPKTGFAKNAAERFFRSVKGPVKTTEKPLQPGRNVEAGFLSFFEHLVIRLSFNPDLRRHAVKTLRTLFGARQHHICERTRNAPVSILERMASWGRTNLSCRKFGIFVPKYTVFLP